MGEMQVSMNKRIFLNFFRFQPSRETLVPVILGLIVWALSFAMKPAREMVWMPIILRDIGMVYIVGIISPLYYVHCSANKFGEFGLSFKKWYIVLPINLFLGMLLLFLLISENPGIGFYFNRSTLPQVGYIMIAGIFEVIFFYSFQRTLFERAFGIIPGIVLASLFYSIHHIGFQPEYGKLFFVGLMYATLFRLGNSALLIYPFFWGVGACFDVFIQSKVVSPIFYPEIRSLYLFVLILIVIIWTLKKQRER
jgi:hypothetical protein